MKSALSIALLLAAISTLPGGAQEPTDVEALRAKVEQLQKTVQDLQQRLSELEQEMDKEAPPAATVQPPAAPAQKAQETSLVPDHNTVRDDQPAAPRPDNVPLDPELKGFVPIPGTVSMFKIGGSARVDAIQDFSDNGNPNWFIPSSMPVDGQPGDEGDGRFALHAKGTRMSLELRRPLGTSDRLRIYYENDFFGDSSSSTMSYRLRHFYGQASNILVGQTFSGFQNIDSWPDVVDYQGPNAMINRRQAQLRYTHPVSREENNRQSVYFSAELPSSEIDAKNGAFPSGTETFNRLPDFVAGYRLERKGGHMQLAALARSLSVEQGDGASESVTGWGVNLSGALNLSKNDRLFYQAVYGEGIARYVNDLNGLNLDAAPDSGGSLEAIPVFAPMLGYYHSWSEAWRSTITWALVEVDAPHSLGASALDSTDYATLNLIWQPTKAFRLGVEYLWGEKKTASGEAGDGSRINFVVKYDLVK